MHQEVNFAGSTKAPELHLWGNKWEKHLQFGQSTKSYQKKKKLVVKKGKEEEKKKLLLWLCPQYKIQVRSSLAS